MNDDQDNLRNSQRSGCWRFSCWMPFNAGAEMNFEPRDIQGLDARHKSDSYQVLNSDSAFLRFEREAARRGKIALAFWAILAIAGFACAIKLFDVI